MAAVRPDHHPRCPATGKLRYNTQRSAENVLRQLIRQWLANPFSYDGRRREEARAYRCPECDGWHLTSQL
jgi:hypothetical protein